MTPADTWEKQVNIMRGMPPAAAKIILILLMSGRTLTNKKIMFACDIRSDKTVASGLAWLEFQGIVQNNGKHTGWSLTAAARQLTLNLQLDEPQNPGVSRKIYDLPSSSSSSYDPIILDLGEEEERKKRPPEIPTSGFDYDPRSSLSQQSSGINDIRKMLIQAGVGRQSVKMRELLEADLDVDFVEAHIEAREAMITNGEKYPVGWLITKLLAGDPVPEVPMPLQQTIPEHLKDIIKR